MIHPKTLLISRHFYSLESYVWRSIYNLKIYTSSTYDIPLDRWFLKLWNDIRYVMPSTERRLELKEKTSMAQNAWQAFVYANGLNWCGAGESRCRTVLPCSTSTSADIFKHVNHRNLPCSGWFACVSMCPLPNTYEWVWYGSTWSG